MVVYDGIQWCSRLFAVSFFSKCMCYSLKNVLHALQRGPEFIKELLQVIPNAEYYKRGTYDLKKVLLVSK